MSGLKHISTKESEDKPQNNKLSFLLLGPEGCEEAL
jgi:hypothetical protein